MGLPPFQSLLAAHYRDVYRFLVAAVGRSDADDCFQETFLSALRAYPRLRDGSNLRGWLFTIAHRKAMDTHRRRRRFADPAGQPEPATAPPRAQREIWDEVRRLPPRQRAAVLLRYQGDLSHREIAEVLGGSEEAARQNVHEGLKRLRRSLST